MAVNDLRCVLAGGVQEEMLLVVLILRAVDVAVTQRKFQVRRELAAPSANLAILLGRLDRLVDRQQGLLIVLRNQARNGILCLAAIDALPALPMAYSSATASSWKQTGLRVLLA